MEGKVKVVIPTKTCFFIAPSDGSEEVFAPLRLLPGAAVGQDVEFEVGPAPAGKKRPVTKISVAVSPNTPTQPVVTAPATPSCPVGIQGATPAAPQPTYKVGRQSGHLAKTVTRLRVLVGRLTPRGANPITVTICDPKGKHCAGAVSLFAGAKIECDGAEYPSGSIILDIPATGLLYAEVVCCQETAEATFTLNGTAETTTKILQKIRENKESRNAGFYFY